LRFYQADESNSKKTMRTITLKVVRRIVLGIVGAILVLFGVNWILIAPPSRITIATAFRGSGYEQFAQRYRTILARSQVDLVVKPTSGTVENISLLRDANSHIEAGFVQGGVSSGKNLAQVVSLGRVAYQPFFLFQRADGSRTDTADFRGQKLAVGPQASETRAIAVKIFGPEDAPDSPSYSPLSGAAAIKQLREGNLDGAFIAVSDGSTVLRNALADESLKPISFKRGDALTKLFPFIVKITVPAGSIDYQGNIPASDIATIGTTIALLVRSELHPHLISLLAQAASETHSGNGFYHRAGEFPTLSDPEFEMSDLARDFYRNGPGYATKYIPWWVTHHVQIALAFVIGIFAVIIPVLNLVPRIVRYTVRRRAINCYRRLEIIEAQVKDASHGDLMMLQEELDSLYSEILSIAIPTSVMDPLFGFKTHLNLVRMRIAARLSEINIPS
jgi:TRAP-type uncharacterized transport system substrate-binding protein